MSAMLPITRAPLRLTPAVEATAYTLSIPRVRIQLQRNAAGSEWTIELAPRVRFYSERHPSANPLWTRRHDRRLVVVKPPRRGCSRYPEWLRSTRHRLGTILLNRLLPMASASWMLVVIPLTFARQWTLQTAASDQSRRVPEALPGIADSTAVLDDLGYDSATQITHHERSIRPAVVRVGGAYPFYDVRHFSSTLCYLVSRLSSPLARTWAHDPTSRPGFTPW